MGSTKIAVVQNCVSLSVDETPDFGQLHVCVAGLNKFYEISPPSP
jgi:hypothetical protein